MRSRKDTPTRPLGEDRAADEPRVAPPGYEPATLELFGEEPGAAPPPPHVASGDEPPSVDERPPVADPPPVDELRLLEDPTVVDAPPRDPEPSISAEKLPLDEPPSVDERRPVDELSSVDALRSGDVLPSGDELPPVDEPRSGDELPRIDLDTPVDELRAIAEERSLSIEKTSSDAVRLVADDAPLDAAPAADLPVDPSPPRPPRRTRRKKAADEEESPASPVSEPEAAAEPHEVIVIRAGGERASVEEAPPAEPSPPPVAAAPPPVPAAKPAMPFSFDPLRPYRGVVRRFFTVYRHTLGLIAGAAVAYVRALPRERRHGLHSWFPRLSASVFWPFLDRDIRRLPFPQQLRRRLEILGPTYIKLGQIMAIREDLLPRAITGELQNLFDRLPAIPFHQVREIIERSLGRPLEESFASVAEQPLGSASIAQAHLAETADGEEVVVKVIKPGVREMIESDLTLLRMAGVLLQWALPRYQPRQIIAEFSAYTRKEVDYTFEADNAEMFAGNFRDMPDVAFPRIYRHLSSVDVLTMEFMRGFKPGSPPTDGLSADERARVVDLGAASIIRMLYRDGFFHADLHAGNLMILPGKRVRVAFIDLGMVGRFEERTRRQMLYYFHALVTGDVEGSTRYLVDMATIGKGGDANGFRRAVADLSRRFVSHAARGEISIAQLILESVGLGGKYAVFFPVEMTLMVKALVTFEGVGRLLDPQLDVAAVSQKHVSKIFQQQFDPRLLMKQVLRGSPELVDLAIRLPQLLTSGFRFADEHLNNRTPSNPLSGIKESILAAACIVGGVLAVIQGASPFLWGGMFVLALVLYVFGK